VRYIYRQRHRIRRWKDLLRRGVCRGNGGSEYELSYTSNDSGRRVSPGHATIPECGTIRDEVLERNDACGLHADWGAVTVERRGGFEALVRDDPYTAES